MAGDRVNLYKLKIWGDTECRLAANTVVQCSESIEFQ